MTNDLFESQWPVVAKSDRYDAFVVKAIWNPPLSQSHTEDPSSWAHSLCADLESAVNSALNSTLGHTDLPRIEATEIDIGSTVEGEFLACFLTIWESAFDIRNYLVPLNKAAKTAECLGRIIQHFRNLEQALDYAGRPKCEVRFTPYVLALACEWHITRLFGEQDQLNVVIDCIVGQLSSGKTEDILQYQISLEGRDRHIFLVATNGKIISYSMNGQREDHDRWSESIIPNVDDWPVQMPTGLNWRTNRIEKHWPTQDGIDRSKTIAFMVSGPFNINMPVLPSGSILEQYTRDAIHQVLGTDFPVYPIAEYYQVGPAAGGIDQFVVTLFNSRDEIGSLLGLAADAWAVSEIGRRVYRRVKDHFQQSSEDVTLYFPVETLIMFCEDYIRRSYHPRAQLKSEWYCLTQEFYGGYSSPGHPTSMVEYLIVVETAKKKYRFRLQGSGEVISFAMQEGSRTFRLELPNLFEDHAEEHNGQRR